MDSEFNAHQLQHVANLEDSLSNQQLAEQIRLNFNPRTFSEMVLENPPSLGDFKPEFTSTEPTVAEKSASSFLKSIGEEDDFSHKIFIKLTKFLDSPRRKDNFDQIQEVEDIHLDGRRPWRVMVEQSLVWLDQELGFKPETSESYKTAFLLKMKENKYSANNLGLVYGSLGLFEYMPDPLNSEEVSRVAVAIENFINEQNDGGEIKDNLVQFVSDGILTIAKLQGWNNEESGWEIPHDIQAIIDQKDQ